MEGGIGRVGLKYVFVFELKKTNLVYLYLN